jgi:hypothetical protein
MLIYEQTMLLFRQLIIWSTLSLLATVYSAHSRLTLPPPQLLKVVCSVYNGTQLNTLEREREIIPTPDQNTVVSSRERTCFVFVILFREFLSVYFGLGICLIPSS